MSAWLDPVRQTLAALVAPATVFFRDDDAGWDDEPLLRLLDVAVGLQVPIALAAIPMALGPRLSEVLRTLLTADDPPISVHQHGFTHTNHEPSGRKCEFGPSRSRDLQRQDLARGRERLQSMLGLALPPIFTPPWNRCTRDTADCLVELGFEVLSRDAGAESFGIDSLHELPVTLDWAGPRGARMGAACWGHTIARALRSGRTTGFMLHHAVMTAQDRDLLGDLLQVLTQSPKVTIRHLHHITATAIAGPRAPRTSRPPGGIQSCSF
jgi:Polysaccharide deacetylase